MPVNYDLYTVGKDVVLTSKGRVDPEAVPLLGNGLTQAGSFPPVFPDFFQMFLMRAKLAYYQGIPLGKDLSVIENNGDGGALAAGEGSRFVVDQSHGMIQAVYQNPMYLYIAVGCFIFFSAFLAVGIWRLWENRTPKI